jgi:hypothetical protein
MITKAIQNCLTNAKLKGWEKTYWAFDIHGTILKPTYKSGVISSEFYPYAKEVLQLLSKREDIVRILFTCSYPEEIVTYVQFFRQHDIHFDHINANPEVCTGAYGHYESKFYFNVLFEDKAGFDPMTDWTAVLSLLNNTNL